MLSLELVSRGPAIRASVQVPVPFIVHTLPPRLPVIVANLTEIQRPFWLIHYRGPGTTGLAVPRVTAFHQVSATTTPAAIVTI